MKQKGYPDYSINRVLTYDFNKSLDISAPDAWNVVSTAKSEEDTLFLNAPITEILSVLEDISVFENSAIYGGTDSIRLLRSLMEKDVMVTFHSLSYSAEIAEVKHKRLKYLFKHSKNWRYISEVGKSKSIIRNADIVIEDNIREAVRYRQYMIKRNGIFICIKKPYNSPENDLTLKNDVNLSHVRYYDLLEEALCDVIERLV